MTSMNPFDLLGDDDNDDPSQLLAAAELKVPKKAPAPAPAQPGKPAAKLPSKPLPPAQAVRESRNEGGRGEGGRGGRGSGRSSGRGGRGGFNRDSNSSEFTPGANNGYSERRSYDRPSEEGDGRTSERRGNVDRPRGGAGGGFRGGRRGGFSNGDAGEGERPRRTYERHSGTGRGNEIKRDGSGRGNWGTASDDIAPETEEPVAEVEKNAGAEKQSGEEDAGDANKDNPANETEEKEPEPEDKEMTLEEYEKLLDEKRKALLALKAEERKVELDKELKAMQPLSNKKSNDEIFIKLGSEKDKKKEAAEKEERAKKSVSINEFLKPADGERYHGAGGRGRGRGRGSRGGFGGGYGFARDAAAPQIEDPGQFPSLGGN